MVERIKRGKERWKIVGMYVREGMEKAVKGIEHWIEDKEEGVYTTQ